MFSMTGFASYEKKIGDISWALKISTVNSKFLEINIDGIKDLYLQDIIRRTIKEQIHRAKVLLQISHKIENSTILATKIDDEIFSNYLHEAKRVATKFGLDSKIELVDIIRVREVWRFCDNQEDEILKNFDENMILEILQNLIKNLRENQLLEGRKLKEQFKEYVKQLEQNADILENLKKEYELYLKEKIEQKLKEIEFIDEQDRRIAERELNLILLKGDFEEEIVRVKSHLKHFKDILNLDREPIGKKMGFLVQELNREFNTLGDKINSVEGKKVAMESKLIIDRIREQALNVE